MIKKIKLKKNIVIILFSIIILASCMQNSGTLLNKFNKVVKERGYTVMDVLVDLQDDGDAENFKTYLTSTKNNITCDFVVINTEVEAENFFEESANRMLETYIENIESSKDYKKIDEKEKNAQTYIIDKNDTYIYFRREKNEIIYLITTNENKEEAESLIKDFGF